MDKRLEQALDFSNFRMILSTKQNNLKVLMNHKLMLTYQGGLFKINEELLTFIKTIINSDIKEFIFIDNNDIPILIEDVHEFWDKAITIYKEVLMDYYKSYQKLNKAREIRKVINWNDGEKTK